MTEERWQALVSAAEGGAVTRGTMFGSQGLRTGRKYFAIRWHDQLVVKLPAGRLQELIAAGDGEAFEPMPGRAMNGWLVVGPSVDWPTVTAEARAHVEAQQ